MKLETSANIIEKEVDGVKYSMVSYTRTEEILNVVTHGAGALAYIGCMIYLLTISVDARTVLASLFTCLSAILVYGVSALYHAETDIKKKFIWRKIDHSDVPLVVIGCSTPVCLCLSNHVYNYVALGLCFAIVVIGIVMNVVSVDKFKVATTASNFVIGIIMFVAFMLNYSLIPSAVKYLYLAGALLCTAGSIVFAFKKKYMHPVFHMFELVGTLCFYVGAVIIIQNYQVF